MVAEHPKVEQCSKDKSVGICRLAPTYGIINCDFIRTAGILIAIMFFHRKWKTMLNSMEFG
jgi:hypothetical protein